MIHICDLLLVLFHSVQFFAQSTNDYWLTNQRMTTDWLTDYSLLHCLPAYVTESLTVCLSVPSEWVSEWVSEWLTTCLPVCLPVFLPAGWLADKPDNCITASVYNYMTDWLTDWLSEWLTDWMNEWMNEWMPDLVNDWPNAKFHEHKWHEIRKYFCCMCKFENAVESTNGNASIFTINKVLNIFTLFTYLLMKC